MRNKSVMGIYSDQADAENAVTVLKVAGFRNTDVAVLFPANEGTKDLATRRSTKAPEGAVVGATVGVIAGGVIGWLIGSGLLSVPDLGMLVAAGPIMSLLSGAGAGAILGGLIGAMIGLGIPEYETKRYQGRIRGGGILLSVHCDDSDWIKTARTILRQTGAQGISSTTEANADFAASDRPRPRSVERRA